MSPSDGFIHLHTHSAYSLAEGAIPVDELIDLCRDHDMPAVAVTDTNNLFGALEFAMAATKAGVQPIIGCQVRLGLEGHQLVLLVQNEQGYKNICRLISDAFLKGDPLQEPHLEWATLAEAADGLICLTGGIAGPVAQYLLHNQEKKAQDALKTLKKMFPNRLYVELQRHGLPQEESCEEDLLDLAYKYELPLVATNNCYFATRDMHDAHDALLCIAGGRYVTEADRRRETAEHYFKSADEMRELFADLPEAVDNTIVIAQRCHFLLKSAQPALPKFVAEAGRTEVEELQIQSRTGLEWRLENFIFPLHAKDKHAEIAKPYRDRLEFELGVIGNMGYPGYFLIVSDFIRWAKAQNIPVGPGRGSGAGSVVAWALQITDLDPLQFNLLFERFLNPDRVSMPDFDIDFCQERRDEVIAYVQDRYGHDRVAQIITFGKLQARAVVRDVGRVLQLPYGQVDRIAKMIPNNPAAPTTLGEALARDADLRAEIAKEDATERLIDIALKLEGLYRHASTHAAGLVISDRPLQEMVPLYRDPRSTMPVTQFSMKYVENAGLVKFDFLGLKTMTVIQKSVELINRCMDEPIDILKVPLDDEKSYKMLADGKTTGVFQLESAGMRDVVRQMKISNFEQIIALVALYRPGPMDNIPKYLACLHGTEERNYMHPLLQPILEETYGVMVYQEQVMQAAQIVAGYTLGGADLLRRAMGKKIKKEMDAQRATFIKGAADTNQVPAEQAEYIFEQIEKFAGYGFNKSHAAAYALIAYWTAWLKANHPVEFMTASMMYDRGNTDKLAVFKQECDRMGVALLLPDINKSYATFTAEYAEIPLPAGEEGARLREGEGLPQRQTGAVRYALAALKAVGEEAMRQLVAEREQNGPFTSLQNLADRLPPGTLNKRQLENMACAGVFDSIEPSRARAHAAAETLLRHGQAQAEERAAGQINLFGGVEKTAAIALELPPAEPWDPLEKLRHEFDAVGFYLSAHPLDTKAGQLERLGVVPMATVEDHLAGRGAALFDMAGVLLKKQIKVSPKSGNKYAFLQLSDATGVYEVTLFSEILAAARDFLTEGEALLVKVAVEQREDQLRYTVQSIAPLDKALANKVREVHIHLESAQALPQMKTLLEAEGRGPIRVVLHVRAEPHTSAEITLPQRWNFSPQTRNMLMKTAGISEIREL